MPTLDTWEDLTRRFAEYRLKPSPTGMSRRPFTPSGRKLRKQYLPRHAKNANNSVQAVNKTVDVLRSNGLLPNRPSSVAPRHVRRIVRAVVRRTIRPKPRLRTFWEALVLYRADFTCAYCGRGPGDLVAATKGVRSLRLVVDHCIPIDNGIRKGVLAKFKDLSFKNCVCACWVCNTIKAHWPLHAFEQELRSLTQAVARQSVTVRKTRRLRSR